MQLAAVWMAFRVGSSRLASGQGGSASVAIESGHMLSIKLMEAMAEVRIDWTISSDGAAIQRPAIRAARPQAAPSLALQSYVIIVSNNSITDASTIQLVSIPIGILSLRWATAYTWPPLLHRRGSFL